MERKHVGIDWDFHPKECAERCYGDNDRISQLPDDILISILCLLPMKEAARTSVLSSRWINLWKHISCLDFDAESALVKIGKQYELLSEESDKYVKWVNRVLRSHEGSNLKEFRVCFHLSQSDEDAVTGWLEYALSRHVGKLDLDFSAKVENKGCKDTNYAFPEKFPNPPSQSSCINFNTLKALSLKCVSVTGEAIETLLRMCPLLEKLVVHFTSKISNLEVCGPSLALKHLELLFCFRLNSIKVSAPNLTSLTAPKIEGLLLENVPALVEVSVNCMHHEHSVQKLLPTLSCCIFQLETLSLLLDTCKREGSVVSTFPELPKLKKLVIECWTEGDKSLMGLTPLIRTSPYLQEFVLKLNWFDPWRSDGEVKNTIKFPHEHLKVFKFSGYYGRSGDVELVGYILDNCVALEKLIIDPRYPFSSSHKPLPPKKLVEEQTSRVYAKQLEAQVPQHIELVIL